MKAVRQTAQNAVKILAAFFQAYGAEQMKASYGWEHPPLTLRYDRFWAYVIGPRDDEDIIGWGGMFLDPRDATDDEAVLSVGVFPTHQRKGHRHAIYDHMSAQAQKLGADRASIIVLKSNEAQYQRTMREAHTAGSAWVYAGDNWYPAPGYGYFVRLLS